MLDAERRSFAIAGGSTTSIASAARGRASASDDLKQALDDVLAGREGAVAETPVDGCLITLPRRQSPPRAGHVLRARRAAPAEALPGVPSPGRRGAVFARDAGRSRGPGRDDRRGRRRPADAAVVRAAASSTFSNERGLSPAERETIVAWVKTGRPAGDAAKAPPPRDVRRLASGRSASRTW